MALFIFKPHGVADNGGDHAQRPRCGVAIAPKDAPGDAQHICLGNGIDITRAFIDVIDIQFCHLQAHQHPSNA